MASFVADDVVFKRMEAAQNIPFDLNKACGRNVFNTVDAHCKAIGAPHPFIFFPLLTVIASCMGVKASIQVNEEWREPAILWTVVAARKGEKKTPACKRLTSAITKLEQELLDDLSNDGDEDMATSSKATSPPQLLVDYFSFEELYNLMSRNGCQILAVNDEVMVLYQQLDLYKPSGSKIDKTTLLSLFNGGSWNRNFKNNTSAKKMPKTAFNYTGFIQPKFLIDMLNRDDHDGFYDRLMVVCPKELRVPFRDLQVPLPQDIVDFLHVFKGLRNLHEGFDDSVLYTFDDEAMDAFADMHDELQDEKSRTNDENRRGHLIKAITQLVRLAGIIHAMELAFDLMKDKACIKLDQWNQTISLASLQRAWYIIKFTLDQKFALMPPMMELPPDPESDDAFINKNKHKIKKLLSRNDFPMTPSAAVRNRCIPFSTDKGISNAETAAAFFVRLHALGLGTHTTLTGKNKRQTTTFNKRKFEDLNDTALDTLKRIKMTRNEFEGSSIAIVDIEQDAEEDMNNSPDTSQATTSTDSRVDREGSTRHDKST